MLRFATTVSFALMFGLAGIAQAQAPKPVKPDAAHVAFTLPKDIKWTVDPAFGEDIANLVGDPSKPGPYVILIRWAPHHMSTPHVHNGDRNVYVVSGTWWVSDSPHYDPSITYPIPAGSFVVDKANQIHWDGAKDEPVILQMMGMGPATTVKVPEKK